MKALLETCDLKRLVKATAKFISQDENRRMLRWIRLDFNKDTSTVKAVASDGWKMSIENANCVSIDESFTVYIKPYLPVKVKDKYSTIELSDGKCFIDIGGSIAGYVQPKDEFMDYVKVIADIETVPVVREVYFSKALLVDALNSLRQENYLPRLPVIMQLRDDYGAVSVKMGKSTGYVLPMKREWGR